MGISGISDTRIEPEMMTQNSSSSGSLTSSSKKRMIKERKKTKPPAKQKKRKSQDSEKINLRNTEKDDNMLSSSFDQKNDISDTSISGISDTRIEPEKMTQNSSSSGSLTSSSKKRMIKERKK